MGVSLGQISVLLTPIFIHKVQRVMTCNRFDSYWRWYNGVAVASFFS